MGEPVDDPVSKMMDALGIAPDAVLEVPRDPKIVDFDPESLARRKRDHEARRLPDGPVRLNGLMLVEEFNDTFGLNLSDPNYETIAGYVMGRLDLIPKVKDEVDVPLTEHETLRLRVEQMDGKRIARLVLRRVPVPTA